MTKRGSLNEALPKRRETRFQLPRVKGKAFNRMVTVSPAWPLKVNVSVSTLEGVGSSPRVAQKIRLYGETGVSSVIVGKDLLVKKMHPGYT
jgi:hypothetical protein